uniref:Uncharacterized protein n=1 Tax=viral metagenome TaxID=1070528 RepID=A0A6H1Z6H0_9ZZZZ
MPGYSNIKQVLVAATKYPAAIEAKLPAGAPKLSTTLLDVAGKIPAIPDFPVEVPEMPAVPELPELPAIPGLPMVTSATVTPVNDRGRPVVDRRIPGDRGATYQEYVPSPYVGVMPEVITRRGM